ncbi:hypothetical protein GCM10009821_07180 [Aeromicrobium halocynthiae]|uniref:Uncharacterized protein n=1 Tax=Aeromicrobium halocynthiae TaxID=560557 RepID=A0ABN2VTH6_9ACTN
MAEPIVRSFTPDPPAAALVEPETTSVHGLSASFDTECRTITRTWYVVDGSRPVTRPLGEVKAKCCGLAIDAFLETCTTYFFAVSTWFHANDIDVASEPVTLKFAGAGHRYVGPGGAGAVVEPVTVDVQGLNAWFVIECRTTTRTWYVVDGSRPVTRPLFVEKAKCIGLDIDGFFETCTTYFFAVSTRFQANDMDVASEPVTLKFAGAGHR